MKRTNTWQDAYNTGTAIVDLGDGIRVPLPLDGVFPGEPGPPGAGVPEGGAPLQVIRKALAGSTTEWVTPTKSMVGLSRVDNTPDVEKPLSEAQAEALDNKADLIDGKVPSSQLPEITPVTDSTVAPLVNGAATGAAIDSRISQQVTDTKIAPLINGVATGAAIDARINTQVAPQVQKITADFIAGDRAVVDAAAAAVNANPKIAGLVTSIFGARLALDVNLDTLLSLGDHFIESDTYADTARGFPIARGGRLRVEKFNEAGTHLVQTYYPFRHPGFFIRYIYSSAPYVGTPYGASNKGWQEFRNWTDIQAALNGKADAATSRPARSDPQQWAAVGDSLTDGYSSSERWNEVDSFPSKLQATLPAGTTVTNYGQSGATSDQINLLLGITAFRVRVPSGTLPASGAVALETEQAIGGWTEVQDLSFPGHLEGVYGSLKRTSGVWTFTRAAAGSAIAVKNATFRAHYAAMPSLAGIAGHSLIVGYGRNDISKNVKGMEATVPDHVIRAYTDAFDFMSPVNKQFIFAGTITRTDEDPDSAGFEMVREINSRLRQLFPANFVDLQGYLTGAAVWADTGITPTPADLSAQVRGMTPPSLFDDVTHYNRATAKAIGENLYAPFLRKRGWV